MTKLQQLSAKLRNLRAQQPRVTLREAQEQAARVMAAKGKRA